MAELTRKSNCGASEWRWAEIESVACDHEGVQEAAAVVVDKDSIDARLVLFITQGLPSAPINDLEQHLKGRLAAYMVPSHIFSLIQMPRSGSGKLDRNALTARIDVDMGGDLHEIDAVLESHGLVASAATVIFKGRPASLVVCRPHAGYGVEKELTAFCRIKLPPNSVPSEIVPHYGKLNADLRIALSAFLDARDEGLDYRYLFMEYAHQEGVTIGGRFVPTVPVSTPLKEYVRRKCRVARKLIEVASH